MGKVVSPGREQSQAFRKLVFLSEHQRISHPVTPSSFTPPNTRRIGRPPTMRTSLTQHPDIHPPARYFLLLSERLATSRCFQRCHDPQLPCRKPHESFSTPRGSEYSRLCHLPNIPTDRRAGVAIVSHLELLDDIGQTRVEHASGSFDIERKDAIADRICHPILLDV